MAAYFPNMSRLKYWLFPEDQNAELPEVAHTYTLEGDLGTPAPETLELLTFTPETTAQSRVFQAAVTFNDQVDIATLPDTAVGFFEGGVPVVWVNDKDETLTSFFATVGTTADELPNDTDLVFDFRLTRSLSGNEVEGQQTRVVSVSYPT